MTAGLPDLAILCLLLILLLTCSSSARGNAGMPHQTNTSSQTPQIIPSTQVSVKSWNSGYLSAFRLLLSACLPIFFLFLIPDPTAVAEIQNNAPDRYEVLLESPRVPEAYGETVYRQGGKGGRHLYIVGIIHRSSLHRLSSSGEITKAQAEIFRIGEWLNRNKNIELILPEGFFGAHSDNDLDGVAAEADLSHDQGAALLDNVILEQRLEDESCFTNAEMLLLENYPMRAHQIENGSLYDAISSRMRQLARGSLDSSDRVSLRFELDHLQKARTAAMIQRIPEIIESEFQKGNIRNRTALFTIGLNHLDEIIRFLDEDRIGIKVPPLSGESKDDVAGVNLIKQGFGITVIIPRTLADDREVLRVTRLEKFVTMQGTERIDN